MAETKQFTRVLLTNDDGFGAPGLVLLAELAKAFAQEVWIVAPHADQSGASQKITITQPLFFHTHGGRQWSLEGTPSDCVATALSHFMKNEPPDLILSGVNGGSNIGDEIGLSGTIGAALTGIMHGVPALAISQDRFSLSNIPWDITRAALPSLLTTLFDQGWPKDVCPSINIPKGPLDAVKGLRWTKPDQGNIASLKTSLHENPRGTSYLWLSIAKQQAAICDERKALDEGYATITPVPLRRGETAEPRPLPLTSG